MARNHRDLFAGRLLRVADFARCVSHPARVAIIELLQEEELCCGEIVERLPLAQPTVSQHLKALVEGGLIAPRECGPSVCYRLNAGRLRTFCRTFQKALGTAPSSAPGGRAKARTR